MPVTLAILALACLGARAQSSALAQLRAQAGSSSDHAPPAAAPTPSLSGADAISQSLSDEEKSRVLTAADYAALKSRGQALRAAPGSDWVPADVRASVLAAVDFAFAHGMADELSWRDFFHGHVELDPGAAVSPELARLVAARSALSRRCDVSVAYGERLREAMASTSAAPKAADFARDFYAAPPCDPDSLKKSYVALLDALIASPGWHIIFHTRETTNERLDPAGTNRTILAKADGSLVRVPFMRSGEPGSSEISAGTIQVVFFVDGSGQVFFYPSEDIFILQRGWFYDNGLKAPF